MRWGKTILIRLKSREGKDWRTKNSERKPLDTMTHHVQEKRGKRPVRWGKKKKNSKGGFRL